MKKQMDWLKFCVWILCGIPVSVGFTMLLAQAVQWIPAPSSSRALISRDAFLLCCGVLFTCWALTGLARHVLSVHADNTLLQAQYQVRPYITSSFDCSVKHAVHDTHSFFVQVYGNLVSAAAPPDRFLRDGFVRDQPKRDSVFDSYSAPEGKCMVAYRLENICTGAAVHFSVTINNQRQFQFQSLGANDHLTLYLMFDNLMLKANECLLHITLRYQDTFSLSEYTQTETATVMCSFGQCPTVVGRMEDILTPPKRCALTPVEADGSPATRKTKRKGQHA